MNLLDLRFQSVLHQLVLLHNSQPFEVGGLDVHFKHGAAASADIDDREVGRLGKSVF